MSMLRDKVDDFLGQKRIGVAGGPDPRRTRLILSTINFGGPVMRSFRSIPTPKLTMGKRATRM